MLRPLARALLRHSSLRFIVTGGLSLVVDVGTLFVLHGLLGIWLPVATVAAFGFSFAVNFALNRIWTFEADDRLTRHLWRYTLLTMANLGLNVLLITSLSRVGVPYLLVKVCVTACLAVMNYFISRKWIFTMAEPATCTECTGSQQADSPAEASAQIDTVSSGAQAAINESPQPATAGS